MWKFTKKRNIAKARSITCSYIWHIDIPYCTLTRHTIFESLVKINYFRYEWWSIMSENSKKMQQNQGAFHNLQLHRTCQYIKICVLIRHTFYEGKSFRNDSFDPWIQNFKILNKFDPLLGLSQKQISWLNRSLEPIFRNFCFQFIQTLISSILSLEALWALPDPQKEFYVKFEWTF